FIPANKTVYIDQVTDIINDTSLYFIAMDLLNQSGDIIDRTVTWTQRNSKWQELLTIPSVDVDCKLLSQQECDEEIEYVFEVSNTSEFPLVNMMLEITDRAFGQEILPAFWENNALTMMPEESTIIKVRVRKGFITKTPFILAEGLNVNPASWNLTNGEKVSLDFKVNEINITTEDGAVYLNYSATQTEDTGNRITTLPLALKIDSELNRYVSIGIKYGMDINGSVLITDLTPGSHQVQFGDLNETINY
ncbi:unnamed protein product, partial [marine sediment metagenome]